MEDSVPPEGDTNAMQGLVRRVIPQWILLFYLFNNKNHSLEKIKSAKFLRLGTESQCEALFSIPFSYA